MSYIIIIMINPLDFIGQALIILTQIFVSIILFLFSSNKLP